MDTIKEAVNPAQASPSRGPGTPGTWATKPGARAAASARVSRALYVSIHRSTTAAFSSPDIASLLSRSPLLPLVACPTGTSSSGNGPRISTRYLAATAISVAMSGGADGGEDQSAAGSPSSTTNCSKPAGVAKRSKRAGAVPSTRNPCGMSRGPRPMSLAPPQPVGCRRETSSHPRQRRRPRPRRGGRAMARRTRPGAPVRSGRGCRRSGRWSPSPRSGRPGTKVSRLRPGQGRRVATSSP